jgi:hypothetical protein
MATRSTAASPWRDKDSFEAERENLRDSSSVIDKDIERETEGADWPRSFLRGERAPRDPRDPREEAEEARMSIDPAMV